MRRRELLTAAALAALPWRKALAATEPGWRTFEVTTRVEILQAKGVSRAWLPLPLQSEWQRAGGNSWKGNAARMEEVRAGKYGTQLFYAEWNGESAPVVELTSRVATKERAVDLARKDAPALGSAEAALYTAPTELIPCDGLVRETALLRAAKGARTDLEKGHALYDWIVQNTVRDPKTKGCGTGNIKAMLESGNLGGKCADLNGLFVGFCRSLGIPARDLYGLRMGKSEATKSQHCRAEFFAEGVGWVPADPADVRKLMLEQSLPLDDARVEAARKRLFGAWDPGWIAWNGGHDVPLPNGPRVAFLMYPNGETGGERLDQLDAERFRYSIAAREV